MRRIAQIVSILSLAGTVAPPALYLAGSVSLDAVQWALLVSMLAWFGSAPIWMRPTHEPDHPGQVPE